MEDHGARPANGRHGIEKIARAARVEDQLLEDAEDALDAHIARDAVRQVWDGSLRVVKGDELERRLAILSGE
jgi:type I restriction enzyme M protein